MPYVEYVKHRKIVNALLQLTRIRFTETTWSAGPDRGGLANRPVIPGNLKIQGGQTSK